MLKAIEDKRKWISDKLVQFVNIVFGAVIGQSILHNIKLIQNPAGYPFQFLALIVVIVTVALSWIGYHKSMYKYPYKAADILSIRRIRPFTDFIIVVVYTLFLFSIDAYSQDPAGINLFGFVFFYVLIFALYIVDGYIRIIEYRDHGASKINLSFRYLLIYGALALLYFACAYVRVAGLVYINYATLIVCLGVYLWYRIQREPHYPEAPLAIVVDVDGVLADQVTPVLEELNRAFGCNYTKKDIVLWDQPLPLAHTDIKTEIERSHGDPDFVMRMQLLENAQKAMMELSKCCEITIATSRVGKADRATRKWLSRNNVPYDHYQNTSLVGKGVARGNILIDDYPRNIMDFLRDAKPHEFKKAYLFTQPWNETDQLLDGLEGVERVGGWEEILEKIRAIPAKL